MKLLLLTTAFAALAIAQSVTGTSSLSSVTCGSNRYTAQQILDATTEACRLYAANQQLGTNNYPHQFNNREGLIFAASGPYQEFPVIAGGAVYTGRESPLPFQRVMCGQGLNVAQVPRARIGSWSSLGVTSASMWAR